MNEAIFKHLVEREYNAVIEQCPDYPYSLETVTNIFLYFFSVYQSRFGDEHPNLKLEHIRKIIAAMPYVTDLRGGSASEMELDDGIYFDVIDQYFDTEFRNCDYRISHFFSGNIRILRIYELGYF